MYPLGGLKKSVLSPSRPNGFSIHKQIVQCVLIRIPRMARRGRKRVPNSFPCTPPCQKTTCAASSRSERKKS